MNLESLDLETLRAQRPDLLEALRREGAATLEEVRQILEVAYAAGVPGAVRDLRAARVREEIAALVDAELPGDPCGPAVKQRLVEECATVAEARERLARERAYALELRQALLPAGLFPGLGAAGRGLVENPEEAALNPEQAHTRRLAGL